MSWIVDLYRQEASLKAYWPLTDTSCYHRFGRYVTERSSTSDAENANLVLVVDQINSTVAPDAAGDGPFPGERALKADGNNGEYLYIASQSELNTLCSGASAVTICCWIKVSAYPGGTNWGTVLVQHVDGASSGLGLSLYGTDTIRAAGRSQSADAGQSHAGITGPAIDTWGFIAGQLDFAGDQIGIKLNTAAMDFDAVTFGATTYTPGTPNQYSGVFGHEDGANTIVSEINASVCHLAVFNSALSDTTLNTFANATRGYRPGTYTAGGGSLNLILTDEFGNPIPNLTGLRWFYYPDSPANIITNTLTPSAWGSGATTDANGLFSVSSIDGPNVAAGNGYIVITDSDGNPYNQENSTSKAVTLI